MIAPDRLAELREELIRVGDHLLELERQAGASPARLATSLVDWCIGYATGLSDPRLDPVVVKLERARELIAPPAGRQGDRL